MSEWRAELTEEALRRFAKLDKSVRQQVTTRLRWFAENFNDTKIQPLHEDFKGCFKLRVGDWRIAYTRDSQEKKLIVHVIEHRSKIYKRRK